MAATTKKVVNPEKEMRGKKPYNRHGDGAQKKKSYQAKPKKLDAGEAPEGAAALKKKLRDTLRLLGKSPKMPADIRLEHERRIEALKLQIADKHVDMTEQKMQTKYRMLKFIESKKADRKINVYKKQHPEWENNPEEKAALEELELDLAYIRHFPKTMKYISLYPSDKGDNEDGDEAATEESREASAKARTEIREQIRHGLASGDIQQFVKQVREQVKEKIVKKEYKLTTEEAIKLTAENMNKSKKRSLAESDNPQLAARAKATAQREATKEVKEEVEEESFFETVPKVVPAAEVKKGKKEVKKEETKKEGPAAKKAKTNIKQEAQETKAPVAPATEEGEPKKLGKWAKKALRAQQTFAAAAASSETIEEPAPSVTASEPEKKTEPKKAEKKAPEPKKAAEKKTPEPKKAEKKKDVQVKKEEVEKKTPVPKKAEKKTPEPKKAEKTPEPKKAEKKNTEVKEEVAPKISVLKVDPSDKPDSDSESEDEKLAPARPVVKVDETLLKEIPEVPRKRGGRNQKAYVEKPKVVEAPKISAVKVETVVAKREKNDSSSEDEKPAETVRKVVKVDETLLKELPEVPKKRGGRNLNKYK
ncbi:18S rRNA maturation protein [Podila minutissima]|nr:18S rRNA maturation protein [Podila minutissima]